MGFLTLLNLVKDFTFIWGPVPSQESPGHTPFTVLNKVQSKVHKKGPVTSQVPSQLLLIMRHAEDTVFSSGW